MRGIYAVPFSGYSINNADGIQDLFEIQPIANQPIELMGFKFSQRTDFGDSEEEGLPISVIRGNLVVGSGGTVVTPNPLDPRDGAASFTADFGNTTPASTGTEVILDPEVWNIRQTHLYLPVPELRMKADNLLANRILVVRLLVAPNTDLVTEGVAWVREL